MRWCRPQSSILVWCGQKAISLDSSGPEELLTLRYQLALTAIDEMRFETPSDRTDLRTSAVREIGELEKAGAAAFAEHIRQRVIAADRSYAESSDR